MDHQPEVITVESQTLEFFCPECFCQFELVAHNNSEEELRRIRAKGLKEFREDFPQCHKLTGDALALAEIRRRAYVTWRSKFVMTYKRNGGDGFTSTTFPLTPFKL